MSISKRLPKENGSAMVYAMLFAGITGLVIAGMQSQSKVDTEILWDQKVKEARDNLYFRLNGIASSDVSFKASYQLSSTTSSFYTCVATGASSCGVSLGAASALNSATQPSSAEYNLINPMTATTINGAKYNLDGSLCDPLSIKANDCVFEARTYYYKYCATASPCIPGDTYSLLQVKNIKALPNMPGKIGPFPTNAVFTDFSAFKIYANQVTTKDGSLGITAKTCPYGAEIEKIIGGVITCKCIPSIAVETGRDASNNPICSFTKGCTTLANAAYDFRGIDKDGKPICELRAAQYSCSWIPPSAATRSLSCPMDSYSTYEQRLAGGDLRFCYQEFQTLAFICTSDWSFNWFNENPTPARAYCCQRF